MLIAFVRFLVKPLIEWSFIFNAIVWLYNAKIKDDYFFDRKSKKVSVNFNNQHKLKDRNMVDWNKVYIQRSISISNFDMVKFAISKTFCGIGKNFFRKYKKIDMIFKIG